MAPGTHDHADDPRNAEVLVWVNGGLLPRDRAMVSVFDSGFVLGDGVWEGLRARRPPGVPRPAPRPARGGRAGDPARPRHVPRRDHRGDLRDPARQRDDRRRARAPDGDPRGEVDALPGSAGHDRARDRGDHRRAQGGDARTVTDGITLFTTHVRRATPDTLDPKLNAHSKLNDIQACIQAYTAGADEALMLDPHGFVATCNSTHFFIVTRAGEVWTSDGRFCLGGITRATSSTSAATASPRARRRSA